MIYPVIEPKPWVQQTGKYPARCPDCRRSWLAGLVPAHCKVCHESFASTPGYKAHAVGRHKRTCVWPGNRTNRGQPLFRLGADGIWRQTAR